MRLTGMAQLRNGRWRRLDWTTADGGVSLSRIRPLAAAPKQATGVRADALLSVAMVARRPTTRRKAANRASERTGGLTQRGASA